MTKTRVTIDTNIGKIELFRNSTFPSDREFFINSNDITDTQASSIRELVEQQPNVRSSSWQLYKGADGAYDRFRFKFTMINESIVDERRIMSAVKKLLSYITKKKGSVLDDVKVGDTIQGKFKNDNTIVINLVVKEVAKDSNGAIQFIDGVNNGVNETWTNFDWFKLLENKDVEIKVVKKSNVQSTQNKPLFKVGDTFEEVKSKKRDILIKGVDENFKLYELDFGGEDEKMPIDDFEELIEKKIIKQTFKNQPLTTPDANVFIDKLKNVKEGDIVKTIRKSDDSVWNEIVVKSVTDRGNGDFSINGIDRGQTASLYNDYWEELLRDGKFNIQIVKKEQLQAEAKNILAVLMMLQEIGQVVSYKDPYWGIKLDDKNTMPSYRKEFFVIGDVLEVTNTKDRSNKIKIKIVEINKYDDVDIPNTISYYKYDESSQKFVTNLRNINVEDLFKNAQIDIIQPFNLFELFNEPILVAKEDITEITQESTLTELEQTKKDLGQLLFIRSLISPIDFEEKISVNQVISEKQKKINELNFKEVEAMVSEDKFFDDLFEQSFTPILHQYEGVYAETGEEVDFFTPNGERSKLSDDLNKIIRTPQFKEWFGDWELSYIYKETDALEIECSKVLTENFEPKLVWHGTGKQFSYFVFDNFPAAYFAVNREYSQFFADLQGGDDGYVIPFFLNIRNPLDLSHFKTTKVKSKQFFDYLYLMTGLTMEELEVNPIFLSKDLPELETWMFIRNNPKMIKKISDTKLYDGIHFYETNPNIKDTTTLAHSTEAYITFSADQCKIADPNRGNLLLASLKSFLLEKGGKI